MCGGARRESPENKEPKHVPPAFRAGRDISRMTGVV